VELQAKAPLFISYLIGKTGKMWIDIPKVESAPDCGRLITYTLDNKK